MSWVPAQSAGVAGTCGGRAGSPRKRLARLALLGVTSVLAASCGARVGPYVGSVGAASLAPGSSGRSSASGATTATSGIASPASVPGAAGSASSGTTDAPTVSASSTGGTAPTLAGLNPSNFPFQPAQQAALCPGAQGNTASDTGVTPTTVTLGNVSGITGVLADNFQQAPEAVQALFSAINAAGGICGRKLQLLVEDDGQSASTNAADIADEIPKVLAFVGSVSDADNGGVQEMVDAKIPDIGPAINPSRGVAPVNFSTNGSTVYDLNGHPYIYNTLANGLKAAGNFPSRIAVLAYSIPISADAAQEFDRMFVSAGSTSCFTDYSISPATASLDQDVLEMKQKGCNGVFTLLDVTGNAKLLEAMSRQDWHPAFAGTTFDGYTPATISVPGQAAARGFEMNLPFLPLNDPNPIVKLYESQLATYEPGQAPNGFGIEAWASAEMFVYALLKAGRNPTRAGLTAALSAIDSWDTGGATVPMTPRLHRPAGPCTMAVVVKGDGFQRAWPATGFYCAGTLVQVG